MVWALNELELTPENGIYINKAIPFKGDSRYDTNSAWNGREVDISNVQPRETKITLSGLCRTRYALRSLMSYSVQNYNWNLDPDNVYLIEDLSRRWKIKNMEVSMTFEFGDVYGFDATLITTDIAAEGDTPKQKTGTAEGTSPVSVTGFVNSGDKDTNFDSIIITGKYYNSANLTNAFMIMEGVATPIPRIYITDVLLDTATMTFNKDYTVQHMYEDDLSSGTLFTRNTYSSTNVTFNTDRLDIATGGSLTYKFQTYHPLIQDPVLTLSIPTLTGSPIIEVSSDGATWWEIEKRPRVNNLTEYGLSKLAGSSDFYWRISGGTCSITYMSLESWHTFSGQKPVPYLRSNTSETITFQLTAGSCDYEFNYHDWWNF